MKRVLLAAGKAPWGPLPVEAIASSPGMVLVRSCTDLAELLAAGVAGLADLAVLDGGLPGLDADSIATLRRAGVAVIAVAASPDARDWLSRIGADQAIAPPAGAEQWRNHLSGPVAAAGVPSDAAGSECLAVWGAHGGPGKTSVAIALAYASAAAGTSTLLLDADPDGGSVAQHLGLGSDSSGLVAAVRAAQSGTLGTQGLEKHCVELRDGLRVLPGLQRPDQWIELRPAALEAVLEEARSFAARVVVDGGSDLDTTADQWASVGPARNSATLISVDAADRLVAVGSADAVGLARLLRGLRWFADERPGLPVEVVVNRVRPTLGWSPGEVTGLVHEVLPGAGVHLVHDDVAAADAAMLAARSPWGARDSVLGRDLADGCAAILGTGEPAAVAGRRRFRR